jgi:hypothetical protein
MQIEADQSVCPACGSAYVGPQYDFAPAITGYTCPKCRRDVVSGDRACEIISTSARCVPCGKEMVVSPSPLPTS